jgi:hypothetical protein
MMGPRMNSVVLFALLMAQSSLRATTDLDLLTASAGSSTTGGRLVERLRYILSFLKYL